MMRRRFSPDAAIAAACVLFAMLLLLHWTHFGKIIYALDTYTYLDPWNRLSKQIFAWNTYNSAGGDWYWDFCAWPWVTLSAAFAWIFGSSAGQTLQIGFVFGLSWAAMYAMLRLLRFERIPALIGTCGYAFNPWAQTLTGDIWATGTLFAIPAVGALLIAGARFPHYRGRIRLGLVLVATIVVAVLAVQPARIAITLLPFTLFATALAYVEASDRREFSRWLIGSALLSLAAAAWWMVPVSYQYFLMKPATATQASEVAWNVSRAGFDNVMRILAVWSWRFPEYYSYSQAYDANVLCYSGGFAVAALGAVSLVFRDRSRTALVQLCVGFALAALFLSKGLHEPLAWINALLYRLPASALWRDAWSKFPPLALAALAICTAVVFERLAQSRLSSRWRSVAIAAVLLLFASSDQAFFVGDAWYGSSFSLPSAWVTIPQDWYDAARWLNSRPDGAAMTTLPQLQFYQVEYAWGMHAFDWFPLDLFDRKNVVLNELSPYTKSAQDDAIRASIADATVNPAVRFPVVLRNLGIRYVLFRGDVVSDINDATVSLEDLRRRLPGATEKDFGALAIFDLGPVDDAEVVTGDAWIAGNYGLPPLQGLRLGTMLENVPRIDLAQLQTAPPTVSPIAYELAAGDRARLGVLTRYLWDDSAGTFTAPFPEKEPLSVERLPRLVPVQRTGFTVPAARFVPQPESGENLLSVIAPEQVTDTEMDFFVVNPSKGYVTAWIEIALRPEAATEYVLTANERTYKTVVSPSQNLVWVRFAQVILKSGLSQLSVRTLPAQGNGLHAERAGEVLTGKIRTRVERTFRSDSDRVYIAGLGSIPAGVPVRFKPAIQAVPGELPASSRLGAVMNVGLGKAEYRCFAAFDTDTSQIDVLNSSVGCLRSAGIAPTVKTIGATVLRRVTFVVLQPGLSGAIGGQPLRSASLTWLSGDGVRVTRSGATVSVSDRSAQTAIGAIGSPRTQGVEPQAATLRGILPLAGLLHAGTGYVQLRQTYDRSWFALCFGRCALMPRHFQDATGWNLWWISEPGEIAVVNLLVVVQLLCCVVSLLAVAVAVRTAGLTRRG